MKHASPVGISILTNSDRVGYLQYCVRSLLSGTSYRPLVVGIFDNGSTDGTWEFMQKLVSAGEHGVEFRIEHSDDDLGCGPGTNRAMDIVRDCEFAIHVESDFSLLSPGESGETDKWLDDAVDFMSKNKCDYMYLRRMVNEREMLAHFWSQWMPKVTEKTERYMRCPDFWWSQNPHLRRNNALYESKTLPVKEFYDQNGKPADFKGKPVWNKSEMAAPKPPNAWLHRWGLFVHERRETDSPLSLVMGCGRYPACGRSTCKYGFFKVPTKDSWCRLCDHKKDFTDMPSHEQRFRSEISGDDQQASSRSYAGKKIAAIISSPSELMEVSGVLGAIKDAEGIVLVKGSMGDLSQGGLKVCSYEELDRILPDTDVLLCPHMDEAIRVDVQKKVLPFGIPVVARSQFAGDIIEHERTGFVYDHFSWAIRWVRFVLDAGYNAGQRKAALSGRDGKPCEKVGIKATIITPTFRRKMDIVKRNIGCVEAQSMKEWEHLICSDGEFDFAIDQYVKGLDDPRVSYCCTKERAAGCFGNIVRSEMLKRAQGEYVLFFDDDNLISPEYLEKMIAAIEAGNEAAFAVCRCLHFGPLQEYLGPPPVVLKGVPPKLYEVDTLQVLVRTSVMQKAGWSNEFGYFTDGNTFEKMGKDYEYAVVPETLAFHL